MVWAAPWGCHDVFAMLFYCRIDKVAPGQSDRWRGKVDTTLLTGTRRSKDIHFSVGHRFGPAVCFSTLASAVLPILDQAEVSILLSPLGN